MAPDSEIEKQLPGTPRVSEPKTETNQEKEKNLRDQPCHSKPKHNDKQDVAARRTAPGPPCSCPAKALEDPGTNREKQSKKVKWPGLPRNFCNTTEGEPLPFLAKKNNQGGHTQYWVWYWGGYPILGVGASIINFGPILYFLGRGKPNPIWRALSN